MLEFVVLGYDERRLFASLRRQNSRRACLASPLGSPSCPALQAGHLHAHTGDVSSVQLSVGRPRVCCERCARDTRTGASRNGTTPLHAGHHTRSWPICMPWTWTRYAACALSVCAPLLHAQPQAAAAAPQGCRAPDRDALLLFYPSIHGQVTPALGACCAQALLRTPVALWCGKHRCPFVSAPHPRIASSPLWAHRVQQWRPYIPCVLLHPVRCCRLPAMRRARQLRVELSPMRCCGSCLFWPAWGPISHVGAVDGSL